MLRTGTLTSACRSELLASHNYVSVLIGYCFHYLHLNTQWKKHTDAEDEDTVNLQFTVNGCNEAWAHISGEKFKTTVKLLCNAHGSPAEVTCE